MSETGIKTLMFYNVDATPHEMKLRVGSSAIAPIMAWYGAYYAGDRYNVFVNDKPVNKDQNGELIAMTVEGSL